MLVESLILVDLLNLVASGVNNLQLAVVYFLCICGSCGSGNLANFPLIFANLGWKCILFLFN